jgi:hypothetical protein
MQLVPEGLLFECEHGARSLGSLVEAKRLFVDASSPLGRWVRARHSS